MADPHKTQALEIRNDTAVVLEVSLEMMAHRFLLRPGDQMVIDADLRGAPFSINVYENGRGLQIFGGNDAYPSAKINGLPAEPDWDTPR